MATENELIMKSSDDIWLNLNTNILLNMKISTRTIYGNLHRYTKYPILEKNYLIFVTNILLQTRIKQYKETIVIGANSTFLLDSIN